MSIIVRQPEFTFDAAVAGHWFGGDRFLTHFFNALSTTFPEGERLFIASVRRGAESLADTALKEEISAFARQEGQHSAVHDAHVAALIGEGYPWIGWLNHNQRGASRWLVKRHPRYALAVTVALEHITATLAEALLEDPQWTEPMSPTMQHLWRWHAVEELEHRSVAFDVYAQRYGNHNFRRLTLVVAVTFLLLEICLRHSYLLWRDRTRAPIRWLAGNRTLWGRRGLLRLMVGSIPGFWRRDFHPQRHDVDALLSDAIVANGL
ncbi:MAG: metal-dependent hydrolase [Pseudomonadota bacterium]